MATIHIKNLEKYQPKYKDGRRLLWIRWDIDSLTDYKFSKLSPGQKWLLIGLVCLEVKAQNPIPWDEKWICDQLGMKIQSIHRDLLMLQTFEMLVTDNSKPCTLQTDRQRIQTDVTESKKILHLDHVLLTTQEYEKLIEHFGKQSADERIARLNEYGHTKPKNFKQYGSHYHTILSWARKDIPKGDNLTKQQRENISGLNRLMEDLNNDKRIVPEGVIDVDGHVSGGEVQRLANVGNHE